MNIFSQSSLPYPDIDGIVRNPAFINDVASSRIAELGDVSDYTYFSLLLENEHPELADLFDKMAITEMRHFGLLGKMIIRLGGDPAIRIRHSNPFYGKPERIDKQILNKILSTALEGEQRAAARYTKLAAAMSADKAAALLLERVAADEEHHARMLSRAIEELMG